MSIETWWKIGIVLSYLGAFCWGFVVARLIWG